MRGILVALLSAVVVMGCHQKAEVSGMLPAPDSAGSKGDRLGETTGPVANWFTKDLADDGVVGTSADKAYQLHFFNKSVAPILVAVIDSGVDITHEDLRNRLWSNASERNGKVGVDDDGNGFVDDINGWNFLGSINGANVPTHVTLEQLEVTREAVRMEKLKTLRESQGLALSAEELSYYNKVTKEVSDSKVQADAEYKKWTELKAEILTLVKSIPSLANISEDQLTVQTIQSAATSTPDEAANVAKILELLKDNNLAQASPINGVPRLNRRIPAWESRSKYYYNTAFNPRAQIIGDNPEDFTDRSYGNPVVMGPLDSDGIASTADHGTHVAGIIAAERSNKLGIEGIADAARIMSLRAVPEGDEYDKDIANSVRYAVDNGAKILNMSFGKGYSPFKKEVDDAFAYAARKGVLIIHSAGNDSKNNDLDPSFPNRYLFINPVAAIKGWIDVAASAAFADESLPADFSNFGKQTVELFSPGVDIVSSVPGQKYDSYSGTSMAGPAVAGVAALVWSQYPSLNATEIKAILLQSVQTFPNLNVKLPSDLEKLVQFNSLSKTGGVVNAYKAMLNACQYVGQDDCTP